MKSTMEPHVPPASPFAVLARLLRLALRQSAGHRRRTILIALCTALGNAVLLLQFAQGRGQEQAFVAGMTDNLIGHLEVHAVQATAGSADGAGGSVLEANLKDGQPIQRLEEVEQVLHASTHVVAVTRRLKFGAMFSFGEANWGGLVVGTEPSAELAVSPGIRLAAGRFVTAGAREIVVSAGMARQRGLHLGDSLTVLASSANGSFNAMALQVVGITAQTGLSRFYTSLVYLPLDAADQLAGLDPGQAYELAVRLDDLSRVDAVRRDLNGEIIRRGLPVVVQGWEALGGVFFGILRVGAAFRIAMGGLLALVVLIIVFGSFSVYILERRGEISTLRALGFTPRQTHFVFLCEAALVAAAAAGGGLLVAGAAVAWLHGVGIPAFVEALTYIYAGDRLYPVLSAGDIGGLLLGSVAIATAAAWWPVHKAVRLDLANATNRG